MKRKLSGILLSAAIVIGSMAGCGNTAAPVDADQAEVNNEVVEEEAESTETKEGSSVIVSGFSGELEVMHFSTSEESEGNGGSDGFRKVIADWKKNNPNVQFEENVLANEDYKTQITTLAAADDLPDVFLLQGMHTASWAEQGLIMDLTNIINESPYLEDYNEAYFTPFTAGDKIYGIPALTGGTCTVVVYDKRVWGETFPATWEEAEAKAAEMDVTPIAFGNSDQWQANSCFLSTLGDRYTGPDWYLSIIEKGGASFTDREFVAALAETQRLFTATDLFNKDYNAISNEDAREYYIAGTAAAFIGGDWDVSYIDATLEESDMELHDNTGFAVLPQSSDAEYQRNSQNNGLGYAVAINAKVAEDPEKLAAAIDFAYYITGTAFSQYVAENYGLGGLTASGDVNWSKFDQWTKDYYNFSYVDNDACEIYDSYVTGAVWDVLNTNLQAMMNGTAEPEDVASLTQAAYEANY